MKSKEKPLRSDFSNETHSIELTWLGNDTTTKWAEAKIVPPPANPEEFATLALTAISGHLRYEKPGISVALHSLTKDQATYMVDGGGEELLYFGFRALTPEQNTLDYIGHSLIEALKPVPVQH
jgi:hypothetical protein